MHRPLRDIVLGGPGCSCCRKARERQETRLREKFFADLRERLARTQQPINEVR